MKELKEELNRAGKIHGHICPSLFYGVSLALKLKELLQDKDTQGYQIVLEGKSACIQDGVRSVLGDLYTIEVKNTGACAIEAHSDCHKYRINILDPVRAKINEYNRIYSLPEFRQNGVTYLFSLKEEELFKIHLPD